MKYLFIICLILIKNIFATTDSIKVFSNDIYKCNEDTSVYVKISYPQIRGMKNAEVQNKINSFLKNQFLEVLKTYEEFVSDSEPFADYPADWVFSFETSFKLTYLSNDFLSIVMDHYEFTGGAHGNYFLQGFNFRLSDGKTFQLNDIIKETQFENLSLFCEQEILKQFNANSLADAGLFEDEINISAEQDFYIKPNFLVIQFDPYEIAPYSFGSIEIELRFDRIKNLFKPYLPF